MIFGSFCRLVRECPDSPAFLVASGDRSLPISWRQFADDVAAVAEGIANEHPGGKIAILGENSYEWMVAHAAIVFSGATVVPLDVNLTAGEISARLAKVGAEVLVHSALYTEKASDVRALSPGILVGAFGSAESEKFFASYRAKIAATGRSLSDLPPPDENRTAMIVFTSGTTSEPRGVELTLAGMAAFSRFAASQLKIEAGSRSLMLLPLFHIYGIAVVYAMLSHGVTLGICPDFRRIYDAVMRFKSDFLFLVPALADILAVKCEQRSRIAASARESALKWICSGGAPLSPQTHSRLKSLGIKVFAAYGLTETTALYSISRFDDDIPVGSAGKVCDLAGVETRVSPDGELMIRGVNVFKGYYGDEERTREKKTDDGWFLTGDTGRIDADGTVWVIGRKNRTIVLSSGKKIAPEDLETRILLFPGMREVIVRGDGDSREISAEIFADLPPEQVHAAVDSMNRALPIYMRIRKVYVRSKPFPRTASGKIVLSVPAPPKRTRMLKPLMISLGVLTILVFVLDVFYYVCDRNNLEMSGMMGKLSIVNELVGEVLLVVFAVTVLSMARKLKSAFAGRRSKRGS